MSYMVCHCGVKVLIDESGDPVADDDRAWRLFDAHCCQPAPVVELPEPSPWRGMWLPGLMLVVIVVLAVGLVW